MGHPSITFPSSLLSTSVGQGINCGGPITDPVLPTPGSPIPAVAVRIR